MSEARAQILEKIRHSLRRTDPLEHSVQRVLEQRLANPEVQVQPRLEGTLSDRFTAKIEGVAGTTARVGAPKEVPQALIDYLTAQSLPLTVVMATQSPLKEIDWPPSLKIEHRPARREDRIAVTGAFAGIAETGTLVLLSGPESPTTLNFLPDVHIVVIRREQILDHIEDAWARLRAQRKTMPRTVNMITGPSRTADIEQTIQLGAHGPRSLHVIIVDN
jgi:L-lactate dehydrogenase complex protein LldG